MDENSSPSCYPEVKRKGKRVYASVNGKLRTNERSREQMKYDNFS
jgi:hypothetical protein